MIEEKDILRFYKENKQWLDNIVSNTEYPRILRAAAAAVIEVGLQEERETKRTLVGVRYK